jgi:hypothetical protein
MAARAGFPRHGPLRYRLGAPRPNTLFAIVSVNGRACQTFSARAYSAVMAPNGGDTAVTAPNVTVVGGGITGLACAYYLARQAPGCRIKVLERSNRVGGWVNSKELALPPAPEGTGPLSASQANRTERRVVFETGPHTFRVDDKAEVALSLVYSSWAFCVYLRLTIGLGG